VVVLLTVPLVTRSAIRVGGPRVVPRGLQNSLPATAVHTRAEPGIALMLIIITTTARRRYTYNVYNVAASTRVPHKLSQQPPTPGDDRDQRGQETNGAVYVPDGIRQLNQRRGWWATGPVSRRVCRSQVPCNVSKGLPIPPPPSPLLI